jgi:ABC-2 type transport system permease protein
VEPQRFTASLVRAAARSRGTTADASQIASAVISAPPESLMRRYIDIYAIVLRNSLIRELSFRANFLLWMLVEMLWFIGQIGFFSIIFGQVDRIGDWTKWEAILLVGTHQIIAHLFQAFFFVNLANIPELVRTGKLDSLLVLPIDSQFAVSTKRFGLDSVVNAFIGAVVVCVSLGKLGVAPNPMSILLYVLALGFGIAVHYSIMLSLAAVSFWTVRAHGPTYGYFDFLNIARYPDAIFPRLFRMIFGWIIPVVIVANIPARLLIKSFGQPAWLMFHLVVATTIIFFLSRAFWRFALQRYSSASS